MTPTEDLTYEASSVALLTDAFRGRAVTEGILRALAKGVQALESLAWDVYTSRWLDSAVGDQLDGIGAIVNEPRLLRSDTDYRTAIKIKVRVLKSTGRSEDMILVAQLAATSNGNTDPITYREAPRLDHETTVLPFPSSGKYLAGLLGKTRMAGSYGTLISGNLPNYDTTYAEWGWSGDSGIGAKFAWSEGSDTELLAKAWDLPPVAITSGASLEWTPTSASRVLRMWLRGDSASDGGTFLWSDLSPGAGRPQAETANPPPTIIAADADYNYRPVVAFDGTQDLDSSLWLTANPIKGKRTILVVGDGAGGSSFFSSAADSYVLLSNAGGVAEWYNGTNPMVGTSGDPSDPCVILITDDGTDSKLFVNDFVSAEDTSTGSSPPVISDFALGSNAYGGASRLTGRIAEIAIWNGELTPLDLKQLSTYLLSRYGLVVPAP